MFTIKHPQRELTPAELAQQAAAHRAVEEWHAEWRRREQAIRVKLGDPSYVARSRIAVGLPPCPGNPGTQ